MNERGGKRRREKRRDEDRHGKRTEGRGKEYGGIGDDCDGHGDDDVGHCDGDGDDDDDGLLQPILHLPTGNIYQWRRRWFCWWRRRILSWRRCILIVAALLRRVHMGTERRVGHRGLSWMNRVVRRVEYSLRRKGWLRWRCWVILEFSHAPYS